MLTGINGITGETVRSIRKKLKMTQGDFSKLLNLAQSVISNIERGERKIPPEIMEQILLIDRIDEVSKRQLISNYFKEYHEIFFSCLQYSEAQRELLMTVLVKLKGYDPEQCRRLTNTILYYI